MESNAIVRINEEVANALADPKAVDTLLGTTFKGLSRPLMEQAMIEGMVRGFKLKDFFQKHVYAIPFKDWKTSVEGYSLVTGIDYARGIGMANGVIGKAAPVFDDKDGKPFTCTVTIKRRIKDDVGDFTATVYFDEYSTGKNLWEKKPRTMIAKVAEMHALRMACPDNLAQAYVEEEMERGDRPKADVVIPDKAPYLKKMENAPTLAELGKVWASIPAELKQDPEVVQLKDVLRGKFSAPVAPETPNADPKVQ